MALTVIASGVSLIQDAGRPGYTEIGVSTSGAFDPLSYRLLCRLLDVPAGSSPPSVEILAGTLTLRTDRAATFAVVGGAHVEVDGSHWPEGTVGLLPPGSRITVAAGLGRPAYLGVVGLLCDRTLGSASTDTMSRLGPPALRAGDVLNVACTQGDARLVGRFLAPAPHGYYPRGTLRYIPGPHLDECLQDRDRWVAASISRSGVRLEGPPVAAGAAAALPSLPIAPGAIQVPPSGQPIILGPDAGVTGGYPVAGVVISADLHLLSRIEEGSEVTLVPVTTTEAADAHKKRQREPAYRVIDFSAL